MASAHGPRIYCMLTDMYPDLSDDLRLKFAVKALDDTTGTDDLVPSLLVLFPIPSLRSTGVELADQEQRFGTVNAARREAATIISENRLRLGIIANVQLRGKYSLRTGQMFTVYSEKKQK